MQKFQPMTLYSNWCEVWQFDGKTVQDGQQFLMRWPDGTEEEIQVKVTESSYQIMDHASPCSIPTNKVFVPATIHGAVFWLAIEKESPLTFKAIEKPAKKPKGSFRRA